MQCKNVIIITGASSGIGAACALLAASRGNQVALIGRNRDRLDRVADLCRARGVRSIRYVVDLRDFDRVEECARNVFDDFGSARALIHSAGEIRPIASLNLVSPSAWIDGFRSNVEATLYTALCFLNRRNLVSDGVLVGLSSFADRFLTLGESQYSAGKAAAKQVLQYAANELCDEQMRVVLVNPGAVDTPMQAIARSSGLMAPEDGPISSPSYVAEKILQVIETPHNFTSGDDVYIGQ